MRKLLTAEQLTTWFGRLRLLSLLLALRSKALCIDSIMAQESSSSSLLNGDAIS